MSGTYRRSPVHVVYGGAHLFKVDTPPKFGKIALDSVRLYASNMREFASAMGLEKNEAVFLQNVYAKTLDKLVREPVEDYRIDFEDGYGFRPDKEEDEDAIRASDHLAVAYMRNTITRFCGLRIKSFAPETHGRAARTLELFLHNFLKKTGMCIPDNFVVTLPKVSTRKQVRGLCKILDRIEKEAGLEKGTIGVEIMVETPQAILDKKGRVATPRLIAAAEGRCASAHFGAYDYTSALGISCVHQNLQQEACNFARQIMLLALAPLGVRLVDSVTTRMPVPIHRESNLSDEQKDENRRSVHAGWREHFENVTASMKNGFYQSWDLHPNQLVARYAAVYAFFLKSKEADAARLRGFVDKARQANMTGSTFDDAASANGLINFFRLGLDCGAFEEEEIKKATSLSADKIVSGF
ncbi:MAG TPA: aldolase/citrate lyase family protein [Pyrinomonadaceae bacterium]